MIFTKNPLFGIEIAFLNARLKKTRYFTDRL